MFIIFEYKYYLIIMITLLHYKKLRYENNKILFYKKNNIKI